MISAINDLVRATRPEDPLCPPELKTAIIYGASPRAGLSLISLSKSLALIQGSDEVRWQHLTRMAIPALRHRLRISSIASRDNMDADTIITKLIVLLEQKNKKLAKGIAS